VGRGEQSRLRELGGRVATPRRDSYKRANCWSSSTNSFTGVWLLGLCVRPFVINAPLSSETLPRRATRAH
jgi:hypothetical protein